MYARFNVEDIFDAMVPLDGGRVREDYKSGEFSADYIREKRGRLDRRELRTGLGQYVRRRRRGRGFVRAPRGAHEGVLRVDRK